MLAWIMRENDSWAVLSNKSYHSLACSLTISEMTIRETQELDCLYAIHLACFALLFLARKHQISIYQTGHFTSFRPISHNHPDHLFALLCPQGTGSASTKIIIIRMRSNSHCLVIWRRNHLKRSRRISICHLKALSYVYNLFNLGAPCGRLAGHGHISWSIMTSICAFPSLVI